MSLKEYGYNWEGMKEISYQDALTSNKTVYLLYQDNTEAEAESLEDITRHYNNGGKFGIEL